MRQLEIFHIELMKRKCTNSIDANEFLPKIKDNPNGELFPERLQIANFREKKMFDRLISSMCAREIERVCERLTGHGQSDRLTHFNMTREQKKTHTVSIHKQVILIKPNKCTKD